MMFVVLVLVYMIEIRKYATFARALGPLGLVFRTGRILTFILGGF